MVRSDAGRHSSCAGRGVRRSEQHRATRQGVRLTHGASCRHQWRAEENEVREKCFYGFGHYRPLFPKWAKRRDNSSRGFSRFVEHEEMSLNLNDGRDRAKSFIARRPAAAGTVPEP